MSSNYANEPWNNPDYATSQFLKFETPGDTIVMVLSSWKEDAFAAEGDKPERRYPVMVGTVAGEEKELSLTLTDLKAQVFKLKPRIGDTITMRYLRDGKPKLFDVTVTPAVQGAPKDTWHEVRPDDPRLGPAGAERPQPDTAPF